MFCVAQMSGFHRGDLILLSKPYVYVLSNDYRGKRCDYCFLKNENLKRCSQCCFLYFCNKTCQVGAWDMHKAECKYILRAKPKVPTASMRLFSHILFCIKKNGFDEPFEEVHGHKMTYRRLMSHVPDIKQNVKTCQQMVALLNTLKDYIGESNICPPAQFIEIFGKMCINTFSICDSEMQSIGSGIYLGASIFDHSCEPDAEVVFDGINLSIRAIHDIPHRNVQQIYISYIEQLQLAKDRQEYLKEQYYFHCQCPRCVSPCYDDLLTKTLVSEPATEQIVKFNESVKFIKQMKKNKASSSAIYDACMQELEKQENILSSTHICRIKILELAFDACIENNQWADAIMIGNQLIDPYRLIYGFYHPTLGIHLFKIGKIQNFQSLTASAEKNLLQAEKILRVTHGEQHSFYQDILRLLQECQMYASLENKSNLLH